VTNSLPLGPAVVFSRRPGVGARSRPRSGRSWPPENRV